MVIAIKMAMLRAIMNKKNFPTALPSAKPNAVIAKWFVAPASYTSVRKKARRNGGPFRERFLRDQTATP
jgi:hypothetical protein